MTSLKTFIAIGSAVALLGACASAGVQTASLEKTSMPLERNCVESSNASCTVDKTETRKNAMRGDFRRLDMKSKAKVNPHSVR